MFKETNAGAGEMAQIIKHLLGKHGGQSLDHVVPARGRLSRLESVSSVHSGNPALDTEGKDT